MSVYLVIIGQPANDLTEDVKTKIFASRDMAMEFYNRKAYEAKMFFSKIPYKHVIEKRINNNVVFEAWENMNYTTSHVKIEVREESIL